MSSSPYSDPAKTSVYDRLAARIQFAAPGRDLVGIANVSAAKAVLDVGAGTGVVASAARAAARSDALIVGVDAAIEMIRHAPKDAANAVVGHVPVLPFRDETFDVVIAGFVVSHFENYIDGLSEMKRVCRSNGRVAMSAWGDAANPAAALWNGIAKEYVPAKKLNEAFIKHIPWDAWFSKPENVSNALEGAGLTSVVTETRYYNIRMQMHEYLLLRETSVQGLILRNALSPAEWDDFARKVEEAFHTDFGDVVEYARDVHFGVGTKPDLSLRNLVSE
jgi:ubiquinone/menaquinone biosynthesis C-methylase UbiE